MNSLLTCPTCKGTGQMKYQVCEHSAPVRTVHMKCIDCEGIGQVTQQTIDALERMKNAWCRCERGQEIPRVVMRPGGFVDYVDCSRCGKLIQVG